VCGLLLTGLTTGAKALDRLIGADGRIGRIPPSVPAGLAIALVRDRVRRAPLADRRAVPPASAVDQPSQPLLAAVDTQ
jgi:hypothetical protein